MYDRVDTQCINYMLLHIKTHLIHVRGIKIIYHCYNSLQFSRMYNNSVKMFYKIHVNMGYNKYGFYF